MRILWWSDAPWCNSGYGRQTREVTQRLADAGHDVAICALFGLQGASINWRGIPVYPVVREKLGADMIGVYAAEFGADIVISLYDLWVLPANLTNRIPCPWAAWTPIDGTPIPPPLADRIRNTHYAMPFSKFGVDEMAKAGLPSYYIPLGIDCETFKMGDKGLARAALGFPLDAYIVGMVAMNKGYPIRKAFAESLTAFAMLLRTVPNAYLYLHTTRLPMGSRRGFYFDAMIRQLGIEKKVVFPNERELAIGIPDEQMVLIYQALDVLMSPSMAEGFCLPVVEAQACGTPVITQKSSALEENTGYGICFDAGAELWIPQLEYYWHRPDTRMIYNALRFMHGAEKDQNEVGQEAGRRLAKQYDWPTVMERYWTPFLGHVGESLW